MNLAGNLSASSTVTDESLGYIAGSECDTHNDGYVTQVLPDTQLHSNCLWLRICAGPALAQ